MDDLKEIAGYAENYIDKQQTTQRTWKTQTLKTLLNGLKSSPI